MAQKLPQLFKTLRHIFTTKSYAEVVAFIIIEIVK